MIFLFSFLIGFSFLKKKKGFGFNLLVVLYGISNFLVVVRMDRSGMTQEMAVRNQKVACVLWITEVTTSSYTFVPIAIFARTSLFVSQN